MRPIRAGARAMDIIRFRHRACWFESSQTENSSQGRRSIRLGRQPLHAALEASRVGYPAERGVVPPASAHSFSTGDMIRTCWALRFRKALHLPLCAQLAAFRQRLCAFVADFGDISAGGKTDIIARDNRASHGTVVSRHAQESPNLDHHGVAKTLRRRASRATRSALWT